MIAELYSAESQKLFYDNYALLAGIFSNRSVGDQHINLRMTKQELISILSESEIILPVPDIPVPASNKNQKEIPKEED